jgi:shikimate dehydrogenase
VVSKTRLFAVTGKPISHSRSPLIFNRLFEALSIDAVYIRLMAESGKEALDSARTMNIRGMNVTSPFKEEIARLLSDLDPVARRLEAVNCVVGKDGLYKGYNTDPSGAVGALDVRGIRVEGRNAVVLGAGGAARAAAWGLGRSGADSVTMINRTQEKGKTSALIAGCDFAPAEKMDEFLGHADILVSCLPQGRPVAKLCRLKKGAAVLDADYRDGEFLREARRLGHPAADGLDWLIRQAIPSFRLMAGLDITPETEAVIDRDAFAAPLARKPNLALAGLSGSGKTTIGAALAGILGWDFVDTDAAIEAFAGLSVPAIFEERGEAYFRNEEKSLVGKMLPPARRTVFSLGGGTILDPENLSRIRESCALVWLWVSPKTALKRIPAASRPLLHGPDPEGLVEIMSKSRTSAYALSCDLAVNTETGSPEDLARRIANEMG